MKRALLAGLAVCTLVPGCSSSSSPAAPAPVQTTTTTAPAAPTFPSLTGTWTGTVTFTNAVIIPSQQSVTETCNSTWTNTQSGGTFSGSMTISSSSATNAQNCGGAAVPYTGTVTAAGGVSIPNLNGLPIGGITWNGTPLNDASCGLKAVSVPLAGTVSGRAWTMTQQDSWLCINSTVQVNRTLLIQLTQ